MAAILDREIYERIADHQFQLVKSMKGQCKDFMGPQIIPSEHKVVLEESRVSTVRKVTVKTGVGVLEGLGNGRVEFTHRYIPPRVKWEKVIPWSIVTRKQYQMIDRPNQLVVYLHTDNSTEGKLMEILERNELLRDHLRTLYFLDGTGKLQKDVYLLRALGNYDRGYGQNSDFFGSFYPGNIEQKDITLVQGAFNLLLGCF